MKLLGFCKVMPPKRCQIKPEVQSQRDIARTAKVLLSTVHVTIQDV